MDPSLDDTDSSRKIMRCMQIEMLCVQEKVNDRHTILQVFSMLKNENSSPMANPKKPAYFLKKKEAENLPWPVYVFCFLFC